MKDFEKKWDEIFNNYSIPIRISMAYFCKPFAKQIWKAALEWAADQIRTETNGYFNILKELEDD